MLQVEHLRKVFVKRRWPWQAQESFVAIEDSSFTVGTGEIISILGANGAGKTTTMHILLGLLTPTSGSITYFGKSFTSYRSEILNRVGFATTYSRLPAQLTVYQNLMVYGMLYGLDRATCHSRIHTLLTMLDMSRYAQEETGTLSAGQMTRIVLAKAFLHNPSMVLLDEPTASLDPEVAATIRTFILEQQKQGTSFLITSHNMTEVTELSDRVLVMEKGRIIANNTPTELVSSITTAYLRLMSREPEKLRAFLHDRGIIYAQEGNTLCITVNEQALATLLQSLSAHGITYDDITIQRPTLEDYFLSLSQKDRS